MILLIMRRTTVRTYPISVSCITGAFQVVPRRDLHRASPLSNSSMILHRDLEPTGTQKPKFRGA
ncbi:hypothetical protein F9C07_2279199 [Aspergillus flavus]|uniref:Uncharacterized protein n=1 Tax=Aspergillus flavus (strain ATCC 200026 / FGSC A1120 / IAM 13836 / NRRL 3357 / JCM 12722 / SRRC 167) TaxID=332952 RepID=A0A7U2QX15_ASPFN|nr:hypothetical protein F9C07_2279199 [Aspergillus flavus]